MKNKTLYIKKTNIRISKIVLPTIPKLSEGEVLLKVKKYALTSNNITYAVMGFQLKYWNFFPADELWGIIPVWGFAEVVDSKNTKINVGELCYGYFPMANYLIVKAGGINEFSFKDISEHRRDMAPIYNTYNRISADSIYPEYAEDYIPIIQPLFATSFLNYNFLKSENFFGARNIVITSASSKTALGLAFMLYKNKPQNQLNIIGLTSEKNVNFVKIAGFYDSVFIYKEVDQKLTQGATTIVDMAGNEKLLVKIYHVLGDNLKFVSKIGITDWTAAALNSKIPMAKFFFAPAYAEEFYKMHGAKEANSRITESMISFIQRAKEWIRIKKIENYEDLQKIYLDLVNGKMDPSQGYIIIQ